MLALRRPHRQALSTLALIVLTAAPTGYVAVTSWRVNQPAHVREVQAELSRRLGLQVTLDGVRYPRPGEAVYRGVVLRHPEPRGKSFVEVARADSIWLRTGDRDLGVEAQGLRLRGESPAQAMSLVGSLLSRAGDVVWDRVNLTAPTCEIELGEDGPSYSFHEVAATFRVDPSSPSVTATYRVMGGGSTTRCELVLTRDRKASPVRTTLAFETKEGLPMPARMLDPFFNAADWLGPEARVWGALTLSRAGEGEWEAEFRGDLNDVDLASVMRRYPDHHLIGHAHLKINKARWGPLPGDKAFGWVEAGGELTAGPGQVSPSLVRSLKSQLKFRLPPKFNLDGRPDDDIAFQGLGLTFAMSRDGELRFGGGLGTEFGADVVMTDGRLVAPIVLAPQGASSVLGLINTLVPQRDDRVMITSGFESQRLQSLLPLPDAKVGRARALGAN